MNSGGQKSYAGLFGAKIKVLAGLNSFLEVLGEDLFPPPLHFRRPPASLGHSLHSPTTMVVGSPHRLGLSSSSIVRTPLLSPFSPSLLPCSPPTFKDPGDHITPTWTVPEAPSYLQVPWWAILIPFAVHPNILTGSRTWSPLKGGYSSAYHNMCCYFTWLSVSRISYYVAVRGFIKLRLNFKQQWCCILPWYLVVSLGDVSSHWWFLPGSLDLLDIGKVGISIQSFLPHLLVGNWPHIWGYTVYM